MSFGRSILAVIAGYAAMAALIIAFWYILFPPQPGVEQTEMPSMSITIANLVYGFAVAIFGGWLTGLIAGKREVIHALAVAAIGTILALGMLFSKSNPSPVWYQLSNIVVLTAGLIIGAMWVAKDRKVQALKSGLTSK